MSLAAALGGIALFGLGLRIGWLLAYRRIARDTQRWIAAEQVNNTQTRTKRGINLSSVTISRRSGIEK